MALRALGTAAAAAAAEAAAAATRINHKLCACACADGICFFFGLDRCQCSATMQPTWSRRARLRMQRYKINVIGILGNNWFACVASCPIEWVDRVFNAANSCSHYKWFDGSMINMRAVGPIRRMSSSIASIGRMDILAEITTHTMLTVRQLDQHLNMLQY